MFRSGECRLTASTKRVVRKRVRKGIFSPHGSRSARNGSQQGSFPGLTSALRGLRGSGSRDATDIRPAAAAAVTARRHRTAGAAQPGRLRRRFSIELWTTGSPIAEEDPKTLMQAMDAILCTPNRATPPTAHGTADRQPSSGDDPRRKRSRG